MVRTDASMSRAEINATRAPAAPGYYQWLNSGSMVRLTFRAYAMICQTDRRRLSFNTIEINFKEISKMGIYVGFSSNDETVVIFHLSNSET